MAHRFIPIERTNVNETFLADDDTTLMIIPTDMASSFIDDYGTVVNDFSHYVHQNTIAHDDEEENDYGHGGDDDTIIPTVVCCDNDDHDEDNFDNNDVCCNDDDDNGGGGVCSFMTYDDTILGTDVPRAEEEQQHQWLETKTVAEAKRQSPEPRKKTILWWDASKTTL